MKSFQKVTLLSLATALFVVACDQAPTEPASIRSGPISFAVGDLVSEPNPANQASFITAVAERFIICKTGPDAQFDVTANDSPVSGSPFTVRDGQCLVVYENGGASDDVASMEVAQSGVQLDDVQITQLLCGQANPGCGGVAVINGPTSTTDPASGVVGGTFGGLNPNGFSGVVAHYYNSRIPDVGCTLTQGYWKTHSILGPAGPADATWDLVGGPNTTFFLSGQSWYQVFWTSPSGNAYYNLAHQYMAAKLNVLAGADPTAAASAIATAESLFGTYTPAQIGALSASNSLRKQFLSLATTLDNYNKGLIGPGHCEDEVL